MEVSPFAKNVTISVTIGLAVIGWTYYIAHDIGKKVDFSELQQSLSEFRTVDIKQLRDTVSEFKKVDIKRLSDNINSLSKGLQTVNFNIDKIRDALNREIIPLINRAHDSLYLEIKEVKRVSMTFQDSLSAIASRTDKINQQFQQDVLTSISSLKTEIASQTNPIGDEQFTALSNRVGSLDAKIDSLQKSIHNLIKKSSESLTKK